MRAIRWSDNDRYYGPFTYADDASYRKFSVHDGPVAEGHAP